MTENNFQVATFDNRPFFEQVLRYGTGQGVISDEKIQAINAEAPKGIVQIATAFGSPYLRAEIELARVRIVNLVSLYLMETAEGDLEKAARLIRDNTLLTLSRGGSTLLKELFALPEYPILGTYTDGRVEDFLEFWSRKKSSADYRSAKKQRELYQVEIQLANKLGAAMGLPASAFQEQHCEADGLIRSAILMRYKKAAVNRKLIEKNACFNQIEFAQLLDHLRKKGVAKTVALEGEFSDAEQNLIAQLQRDILTSDLPKISDPSIPLDNLISQLKDRYFIRDHDMEDTANYDALVSKEWSKHTKGKNDIDAIFTLLLCIASKVTTKISFTEASAKTLIKKIRKEGFFPELATQFILQNAPHEKQESLLEDWEDFCAQANLYLFDDWDHDLKAALDFLHENCYVEKAAKKTLATVSSKNETSAK